MENQTELNNSIKIACKGNDLEREKLIRHYKPYVINTVGKICKRFVTWNDDESSIGLMALNKAIDTYKPEQGRSFLNYIYLIVKRDLIDYFKKEEKETHLSLTKTDDSEQINGLEINTSIQKHQEKLKKEELVEEILSLNNQLMTFGIEFEELEKYAPKHKDTRHMLFEMANTFVERHECVEELYQKKKFPVTTFTKVTSYRPKTIERHRKYLITLILIKIHPHWIHLSQHIMGHTRKEETP